MTSHPPNPSVHSAAAVSRTVERFLEVLVIPVVGYVVISRCLYGSDAGLDIWVLTLSIIYAILFLLGRSPAGRLNRVDWSVFAVALAETVSYFNSTYKVNSLHGYHDLLFLLLFYCFVRLHLRHEYQLGGVVLLVTLLGLYLSVTALFSFHRQYAEITAHGFADVTNFRQFIHAFQTAASPVGEWITLYVALLPFPVLLFVRLRKTRPATAWLLLLPLVTMLAVVSATFSRGLYVATAAFFVSATLLFRLYKLTALRSLVGFGASALLLFLLVLCVTPLGRPALDTVSMFKTSSQVRSLEGRAGLWKVSWEVVKDRPLLGLGSYNFPMQYAAYKEEEAVYVGRTFNIVLELLVEKGVVGLLAYCLLFFSFFKVSHENARRLADEPFRQAAAALFMASCIALLVRDLSYSSVFTHRGVSVLLWFIFAVSAAARSPRADGDGAG